MSREKPHFVWRHKVGGAWEQVAGPMAKGAAQADAERRRDKAKQLGSGYSYYWYPEGHDPNV